MEDVLSVYSRPHDPDRPLVCVDETSKQLIAETRVPIPMNPGRPAGTVLSRVLFIPFYLSPSNGGNDFRYLPSEPCDNNHRVTN